MEDEQLVVIFFDVVEVTVEESFVLVEPLVKLLLLLLDLPLEGFDQLVEFSLKLHLHVVNATIQLFKEQGSFLQIEFDNFAISIPYGSFVDELDRFGLAADGASQPFNGLVEWSDTALVRVNAALTGVTETQRAKNGAVAAG